MQRRDPRIAVNFQVWFSTTDRSAQGLGIVSSLSMTGMFVRSAESQSIGSTLRLVFWDEQGEVTRLMGRVVRVMRIAGNVGMGIRFDPAEPATGASLECVIARRRLAALERMNSPSTLNLEKHVFSQFGDAVAFHIPACERCRTEFERIRPGDRIEQRSATQEGVTPEPRGRVSRFWSWLRS